MTINANNTIIRHLPHTVRTFILQPTGTKLIHNADNTYTAQPTGYTINHDNLTDILTVIIAEIILATIIITHNHHTIPSDLTTLKQSTQPITAYMSTFTFKQAFIDIITTIQNGIQTLGRNLNNSSAI